MTARDDILMYVRSHPLPGEHALPTLPHFPLDDGGDRTGFFFKNLISMGGKAYSGIVTDVESGVRSVFPDAKVIASAAAEMPSHRDVASVAHPRDLADVDVAVVRAAFGIAETGSLLLTDDLLGTNALAYLAQHLIVLIDPNDIVLTTQEAYWRPEFHEHRYASFHTGPSATADIEGVLIHGAQGVRSLTAMLVSRQTT